MPRWKTKRARMGNIQYEVLTFLAKQRAGRYVELELRLERHAKQMIQGVHPWIKTKPHPAKPGITLYCITQDGKAKLKIERDARESAPVKKKLRPAPAEEAPPASE